jgi:archaemetzincin
MELTILPLKFTNEQLLNDLLFRLRFVFDNVNILYTLIDIEYSYSIQRRQFYSTKIIESVKKSNPVKDGFVLVLTEMDLFVPVLTHIYGEAELNGRYSIVSVCRLHEEFYTSESNHALLLERSYKEIIHELGHNVGLKHCKDWKCVMHSSSGIEEVDIKGSLFCADCHTMAKNNGFTI